MGRGLVLVLALVTAVLLGLSSCWASKVNPPSVPPIFVSSIENGGIYALKHLTENKTQLVLEEVRSPNSLLVDYSPSIPRLYWSSQDHPAILSCQYEETTTGVADRPHCGEIETVFELETPASNLAFFEDYLYWATIASSPKEAVRIQRGLINTTEAQVETVFVQKLPPAVQRTATQPLILSIAIDLVDRKLYASNYSLSFDVNGFAFWNFDIDSLSPLPVSSGTVISEEELGNPTPNVIAWVPYTSFSISWSGFFFTNIAQAGATFRTEVREDIYLSYLGTHNIVSYGLDDESETIYGAAYSSEFTGILSLDYFASNEHKPPVYIFNSTDPGFVPSSIALQGAMSTTRFPLY